jgi:hypothetical protein
LITIPESLWEDMQSQFCKEMRLVEQVCYLDGVLTGDIGVVTTITIPCAKLEAGRFHVLPDAMSAAGKHLRSFRLRRLAQVHTHPSDWTGHSAWDDEWAYSQVPGAISIVLPNFGRERPGLNLAGVHLRTEEGWRQLSPEELPQYVRLVPGILDFRIPHETARIEPARRRSWWSALAFWKR